jgi:magnesium-transporting ATPase (P-type)
LKSLNINSWILTGDSKQNAYNVASRIGIFEYEAEQHCIESEKYQDLVRQIKMILGSLSNDIKPVTKVEIQNRRKSRIISFSEKKKKSINLRTVFYEKYDKYILINGRSFDIITQDEYLFSHLQHSKNCHRF